MSKFNGDSVDIKHPKNENRNEMSFIDLLNNIKYYDMHIMSVRRPRGGEAQKEYSKEISLILMKNINIPI